MPELIEVHVRYLGQTGEQKALARRVLDRGVSRTRAVWLSRARARGTRNHLDSATDLSPPVFPALRHGPILPLC